MKTESNIKQQEQYVRDQIKGSGYKLVKNRGKHTDYRYSIVEIYSNRIMDMTNDISSYAKSPVYISFTPIN